MRMLSALSPRGYHSITPALTCKDAGRAMDFYKSVFGAPRSCAAWSGWQGHARRLRIGDS